MSHKFRRVPQKGHLRFEQATRFFALVMHTIFRMLASTYHEIYAHSCTHTDIQTERMPIGDRNANKYLFHNFEMQLPSIKTFLFDKRLETKILDLKFVF
jgi:hypothetical protein